MGKHLSFDRNPVRPHQVRACPANFADVFIRGGWAAVRTEFGLNVKTEKRCLEEAGGDDLRRRRREYLASVRRLRQSIQHVHEEPEPVQVTTEEVRAAISFLRSREGGGWLITATGRGDYYLGATRAAGEDLVERAKRKGFNPCLVR